MLTYLRSNLGWLADVASLIGLAITLIGFCVTILTVRSAKRAAEAAEQKAQEAVDRLGSQLLINQVVTTLQLVREVEAGLGERNWALSCFRCDEARTRLSELVDCIDLSEKERGDFLLASSDLGKMLTTIQKLRFGNVSDAFPDKSLKRIHEIIMQLARTKARLQAKSMEV